MDILVLRLSSLGDIVLSSAFTQSATALWPAARITYVVRADLTPVVAMLPGVARIVAIERDAGLAGLARVAAQLRRTRWAHVFDLHQSARSRFLCAAAGLRAVPGFDKQEWPRFVLLHARRDIYARTGGVRPLCERMLEPLRRLELDPPVTSTRLEVPAPAHAAAATMLRHGGLDTRALVGIAPGARWAPKCWPEERFAQLVARLVAHDDHRVVVVGSAAESALCARVARAGAERALSTAGELDLAATAAVLARCRAVVTHDSGLLHVAEAVGTPVVALFGPTSPRFGYAPHRPDSVLVADPPACSPCSKNGSRPCTRPTHECMENIAVETVTAAVLRAHDGVPASSPR